MRFLSAALSFCATFLFIYPAHSQQPRVIKVTADGQIQSISLTEADRGRDIILLAESTKASAQAFTVGLGGVNNVSARLYGTVANASTNALLIDKDAGFNLLSLRDRHGVAVERIRFSSEGSSGTGGPGGSCLSEHPELQDVVPYLRYAYPGKSDEEICLILTSSSNDEPSPDEPSLTFGTGFIYRSACTLNQKIVAQVRISTSEIQSSDFDGTKAVLIKVALTSEDAARGIIRTKIAEGREKGAPYYMSPTLNPVNEDRYGNVGSDRLLIQTHTRLGALQSSSVNPTRPFFTYKQDRGYTIRQMNISNIRGYLAKRNLRRGALRETFTTVNEKVGKIYSVCMPPKPRIIGLCGGSYSRVFKISCRGL
jgi:hypothetical protein